MEGAIALIVWVGQFGPSKIVRCGNGNEFKLLSGGFSQRGDSVSRGLSKRGIVQAELFLYIYIYFLIYFSYVYISCITH